MRYFNVLAIGAMLAATIAVNPRQALADRDCHRECVGPACEEHCVERGDRDDRYEERRESRERYEEREERDRDRPGIELRVPGVGVEIGR